MAAELEPLQPGTTVWRLIVFEAKEIAELGTGQIENRNSNADVHLVRVVFEIVPGRVIGIELIAEAQDPLRTPQVQILP
jgi:hypothetical protein